MAEALDNLQADGFCILRGVMPPHLVMALAADLAPHFESTPLAQGPFYGAWTRRFHGLLARSHHADAFVRQPNVLSLANQILGSACDTIQLNLTQAIEILPGGKTQPPHRDQDMWPVRKEGVEYLLNVMWPFTPYTAANGATIIWPGSHLRQAEILLASEEAVAAEMNPGDALLFLGSTLHAGGANTTKHSRRGMIVSYSLGWLKPYELPWLAYPPAVARTFPPELAALAGYKAHRPNLGTFEGQCPSALLKQSPEHVRGAIDVLRPEQAALIDQFYAGAIPIGGHPPGNR